MSYSSSTLQDSVLKTLLDNLDILVEARIVSIEYIATRENKQRESLKVNFQYLPEEKKK